MRGPVSGIGSRLSSTHARTLRAWVRLRGTRPRATARSATQASKRPSAWSVARALVTTRRPVLIFLAGIVAIAPCDAAADEAIEPRPPLPEPIFTESTTDIDGYAPGELEFDVHGAESVARRHGARPLQTSG